MVVIVLMVSYLAPPIREATRVSGPRASMVPPGIRAKPLAACQPADIGVQSVNADVKMLPELRPRRGRACVDRHMHSVARTAACGDSQSPFTGARESTMTTRQAVERYRRNFQDEIDSAVQYRAMAEAELDERTATTDREVAAIGGKDDSVLDGRL